MQIDDRGITSGSIFLIILIVAIIGTGAYVSMSGGGGGEELTEFSSSQTDERNDLEISGEDSVPNYVDIEEVMLSGGDGDLTTTIKVGGEIPNSFATTERDHTYTVLLDTNKDNLFDYQLTFWILKEGQSLTLDSKEYQTYSVDGSTLEITIPLNKIGNPVSLSWQVASEWGYYPEEAPVENAVVASDYLPDDISQWIEVTVSGGEGVAQEEVAGAEFQISNLSISPPEAEPREPVLISVDVTNVGDKTGSYSVELKINGTVENTKTVTLDGGEDTTVNFQVFKEDEGNYNVSISGMYGSFEVAAPAPAEFEVGNLTVSPSQVKVGERVRIS